MPRYSYRCTNCDNAITLFHLSDEKVQDCLRCLATGSLSKELSAFNISKKFTPPPKKVGQITEEFIEQSRSELAMQKKTNREKK